MAKRDKWSSPLKCPNCFKTGKVSLEDEPDHSFMAGNTDTTVTGVTDGFKIVRTTFTINQTSQSHCVKCEYCDIFVG